ncbi:saccharopine dehydrogenase NADP-binding domain-containing protein [Actinocorallia sp. A-T 12471]|uniref:saccharopine dehydrogenase NADP-binding domain-containing protein n=1 Tax=Actinocorallia sp. A-T 12471 TaxID=3089813 RepID=UPI0029CD50D8|nr:saccharopine dehydrogenase NADP-binding domain-containing protein [Actinocorallia sp. A-T 12471]MDX6740717.1 saccharopine dehydrogenase NADP-binding domain-containing protein [Actinocorallia sp. A-T 12471]
MDERSGEIWVLGAAGRIGRAVVERLAGRGCPLVLVGRDADRLGAVVPSGSGAKILVTDSVDRMVAEIRRRRPAVVVNTLGGYARTAEPIARACLPGGHYLDQGADLDWTARLFGLHREAVEGGSTLVTGAGFGVLATEAVVAELCDGRPTPRAVRVDALSSVASEAGLTGEAFAATIVDVLTTGGRAYAGGRLVRTRLGAHASTLVLPDGETVRSASAPSAELVAAQRASGAPDVIATSGLAPTGAVIRAALPLAGALLKVPALRRAALSQLAKAPIKAAPMPRAHSWGRAVVTWPDGTVREGWLRTGDGMDFTADVTTAAALRLLRGDAEPGAHTPTPAFGPGLAAEAGAAFFLP